MLICEKPSHCYAVRGQFTQLSAPETQRIRVCTSVDKETEKILLHGEHRPREFVKKCAEYHDIFQKNMNRVSFHIIVSLARTSTVPGLMLTRGNGVALYSEFSMSVSRPWKCAARTVLQMIYLISEITSGSTRPRRLSVSSILCSSLPHVYERARSRLTRKSFATVAGILNRVSSVSRNALYYRRHPRQRRARS